MGFNVINTTVLSNNGGGYAKEVQCTAGMNIKDYVKEFIDTGNSTDYRISVNGLPVSEEYEVQNNDVISIVPSKQTGGSVE